MCLSVGVCVGWSQHGSLGRRCGLLSNYFDFLFLVVAYIALTVSKLIRSVNCCVVVGMISHREAEHTVYCKLFSKKY